MNRLLSRRFLAWGCAIAFGAYAGAGYARGEALDAQAMSDVPGPNGWGADDDRGNGNTPGPGTDPSPAKQLRYDNGSNQTQ